MAVCLAAVLGMMSGCEGEEKQGVTVSTLGMDPEKVYPVKSTSTLSYWVRSKASKVTPDFNDSAFAEALREQTGIKVNFITPPVGQEQEQFNIMLASGKYPDIIETPYHAAYFPGGGGRAIADNILIDLKEPLEKWGPNTLKVFEQYPDAKQICMTNEGAYFAFPFVRETYEQRIYQGLIIRQDWLDDLGLARPETIDEWENVLRAFKEQKGADAPLSFHMTLLNSNAFIGAYGIGRALYLEDGTVKFGPAMPEYKEFLATFRRWFEEGLLDRNILTIDAASAVVDANILNERTGATIGNAASGIGKWMKLMEGKNERFNLTGVKYPVLQKGDRPKFGRLDVGEIPVVSVTTACKDVEAAVRLLDYGYSPRGHRLMNWGIEGESYFVDENGDVQYLPSLKNNDRQLSEIDMLSYYTCGTGPMVQDKQVMRLNFPLPQQTEAIQIWGDTDALAHSLPNLTRAEQDADDVARITNDVSTYCDQMLAKFLTGSEPLEHFDQYVEQLKALNVEKLIAINQRACDQFMSN